MAVFTLETPTGALEIHERLVYFLFCDECGECDSFFEFDSLTNPADLTDWVKTEEGQYHKACAPGGE